MNLIEQADKKAGGLTFDYARTMHSALDFEGEEPDWHQDTYVQKPGEDWFDHYCVLCEKYPDWVWAIAQGRKEVTDGEETTPQDPLAGSW